MGQQPAKSFAPPGAIGSSQATGVVNPLSAGASAGVAAQAGQGMAPQAQPISPSAVPQSNSALGRPNPDPLYGDTTGGFAGNFGFGRPVQRNKLFSY